MVNDSRVSHDLAMLLQGNLRLSDESGRRTVGKFSILINDNVSVFEHYFGVRLFPGSLNVDVPMPPTLQKDLDAGKPLPTIRIPRRELENMPPYLGDGQAWPSTLEGERFPRAIDCWVFRRIGSKVPAGVIEIVAAQELRTSYALRHGDPVVIKVFEPSQLAR